MGHTASVVCYTVSWSRLHAHDNQTVASAAIVEAETNPPNDIECFRCGQRGHMSRDCSKTSPKCKMCDSLAIWLDSVKDPEGRNKHRRKLPPCLIVSL